MEQLLSSLHTESMTDPSYMTPNCEVIDRFDVEPMRIAMESYRLLNKFQTLSEPLAFDALMHRLDRYIVALRLWADVGEEVLRPGTRMEIAASSGARSTLYWESESGEGYSEQRAISRPWQFGVEQETLIFTFPAGVKSVTNLRWDITDRPAFCSIHEAWIENSNGEKIWIWEEDIPFYTRLSSDMKLVRSSQNRKKIFVISLGFDPNAQLIVPHDVLVQVMEGWSFVVTISAELLVKAVPHLVWD
jgi:hypothetical protein